MRMSVRSPICHAASPRPPAFLGLRRRTLTGQKLPCSPQEVTPAPDEPSLGGHAWVWSLDVEKREFP